MARHYRMSVQASVCFWVDAESEEEAHRKARDVGRAFAAPHVLDVEQKNVEVGDVELYVYHDETDVEDEDADPE